MRIAVAGGGGLGFIIATGLASSETANNVIVLSRTVRPEYQAIGVQVYPVNYSNHDDLSYALRGIDLVISTISGPEQISLIVAAGQSGARLFVPSEFEGSFRHRPAQDHLDRGSKEALDLLQHLDSQRRMKYTIFSCGIFMERFLPFGLASLQIGFSSCAAGPGEYLLDMNTGNAEYAEKNERKRSIYVCLTSVHDLVQGIIAAIDIGPANWPNEWTFRGDRMRIRDIVAACSLARNVAFNHQILSYADLASYIDYYVQQGDQERATYYHTLLDTANGRYDFEKATLNKAINESEYMDVEPITFAQWLVNNWQAPVEQL